MRRPLTRPAQNWKASAAMGCMGNGGCQGRSSGLGISGMSTSAPAIWSTSRLQHAAQRLEPAGQLAVTGAQYGFLAVHLAQLAVESEHLGHQLALVRGGVALGAPARAPARRRHGRSDGCFFFFLVLGQTHIQISLFGSDYFSILVTRSKKPTQTPRLFLIFLHRRVRAERHLHIALSFSGSPLTFHRTQPRFFLSASALSASAPGRRLRRRSAPASCSAPEGRLRAPTDTASAPSRPPRRLLPRQPAAPSPSFAPALEAASPPPAAGRPPRRLLPCRPERGEEVGEAAAQGERKRMGGGGGLPEWRDGAESS